jgi:hypothetical protein
MPACPFAIEQKVVWADKIPNQAWLYTMTSEPMVVVAMEWYDRPPSAYALKFGPTGLDFKSGWRITVEYDADSTNYYDPPLSLILDKKRITAVIHEMWLKAAA